MQILAQNARLHVILVNLLNCKYEDEGKCPLGFYEKRASEL
jgi:hypothetical protein